MIFEDYMRHASSASISSPTEKGVLLGEVAWGKGAVDAEAPAAGVDADAVAAAPFTFGRAGALLATGGDGAVGFAVRASASLIASESLAVFSR